MAIKIKVKGINETKLKIKKEIRNIEIDKGLLDGIGIVAARGIKKKVRSGKDPETDEKFAPLSRKKKSTVYQRKQYAKSKKRKSPFFKATKSNLTKTGQMVRNITAKAKGNTIKIDVANTKRTDSDKTNREIAEIHEDGANDLPRRNVFGLPEKTQAKIVKSLNIFIRRHFKNRKF